MTRIDGNDGMKNVYLRQNSSSVSRTDRPVRTEQTAPTTETSSTEFFGLGSKQKSAVIRGMEVEGATRPPKADMEDLNELAQAAGIKNRTYIDNLTMRSYANIEDQVRKCTENIDAITTTYNAEALFASPEFGTFNNVFGMS